MTDITRQEQFGDLPLSVWQPLPAASPPFENDPYPSRVISFLYKAAAAIDRALGACQLAEGRSIIGGQRGSVFEPLNERIKQSAAPSSQGPALAFQTALVPCLVVRNRIHHLAWQLVARG